MSDDDDDDADAEYEDFSGFIRGSRACHSEEEALKWGVYISPTD